MAEGSLCPLCGSEYSSSSIKNNPDLDMDLEYVDCVKCEFSTIRTAIDDEAISSYYRSQYFSRRVDEYEEPASFFSGNMYKAWRSEEQLALILKMAKKHSITSPVRQVLDFGAGHGTLLHYIKQAFPSTHLKAVELDSRMHPYLEHLNAEVLLETEEVQSQSIDLLTSSHSLEHVHVEDLDETLKEFHRILSPQGILFVEVPNENRCRYPAFQDGASFPHLCFFSSKSLRLALRKAGFKILFLKEAGRLIHLTFLNRLECKIHEVLHRFGLLKTLSYGRDRACIRCVAIKQDRQG